MPLGPRVVSATDSCKELRMKCKVRRTVSASVAALGLCSAAAPSFAWDGVTTGRVTTFEITHAANFAFRVYLDTGVAMCGGGPTWAYLNEADSNYKVYVANLMLAKAQAGQVTLFTTNVNGYCNIGHMVFY